MAISEKAVLDALRPIQDPDLGRSIVDLGFVKSLKIEGGRVSFDIELTTPACPIKDRFKSQAVEAVKAIAGVEDVEVAMTSQTRGAPREQREILAGVRNIIAVASGKGGVAKSTTSVNIALALAETGAKVGLLDADIYGPSIPTMLEIDEPPAKGAGNLLLPAMASGIRVISMGFFIAPDQAAILRGPMVSGYVSQFLANVDWGELDYLIVDYPPGTGDIQLTLSQQAPISGAVITTTPQEISLMDVRKALGMFATTKVPVIGVVETMSYFVCDGCGKRHDIFRSGGGQRIADKTGVPLLAKIPIDPRVAETGDRGIPMIKAYPDSPAAVAYRELAGTVAQQVSVMNMEHGSFLETFSLEWNQE